MAYSTTIDSVVVAPKIHVSIKAQVAAAFLCAAILGAKVWVRLEITERGYALAEAQKHTIELDSKRRETELKLSILHRRDHLLTAASERLGLSLPNPSQVVLIKG